MMPSVRRENRSAARGEEKTPSAERKALRDGVLRSELKLRPPCDRGSCESYKSKNSRAARGEEDAPSAERCLRPALAAQGAESFCETPGDTVSGLTKQSKNM